MGISWSSACEWTSCVGTHVWYQEMSCEISIPAADGDGLHNCAKQPKNTWNLGARWQQRFSLSMFSCLDLDSLTSTHDCPCLALEGTDAPHKPTWGKLWAESPYGEDERGGLVCSQPKDSQTPLCRDGFSEWILQCEFQTANYQDIANAFSL